MHRKEEILKFLSDQHEARTQYGAGDNASQKSCNSHKLGDFLAPSYSYFGTRQKGR